VTWSPVVGPGGSGGESRSGGVGRQTLLVDVPETAETARAFVAGAFDALRKEFVIPTPVFHPYVQVGRDYFGDTIRSVPAYHDLETRLDQLYPHRFAEPLKRRHAEFASGYIFSFLEACIALRTARVLRRKGPLRPEQRRRQRDDRRADRGALQPNVTTYGGRRSTRCSGSGCRWRRSPRS